MKRPSRRELIRRRAGERCEYCRMPQSAISFIPFHVDHVIALQHRGRADMDNLAFACERCNGFKGTNLASVDPKTGRTVLLYNPRQDIWERHFMIRSGRITGLTACGRATVELLQMNADRRVELRNLM